MREGKSGSERAPDRPWIFRTYAGHSTAAKSNELYRNNLAKGQTGLSIAFDLPTQTGYDSDNELAKGEVGKVGVPVSHLGDMRTLLDGIPLDQMNTSMTINATAAWLLSLYVAFADEQGASRDKLTGTIQNDIIKEYLSRGTYVFPPEPSLRLIKDTIVYSYTTFPSGTRPTSAPTICRRRARRRCRSSPTRWRRQSPCSTWSRPRARCRPTSSARSWGACRSSSMPACGSSPRSARCAPSTSCGRRSRSSATA